jgi:hypothetical protein
MRFLPDLLGRKNWSSLVPRGRCIRNGLLHSQIWNTNQAVAFVREAGIGDGLTSGEAEAQNCRRQNEIKRMLWS